MESKVHREENMNFHLHLFLKNDALEINLVVYIQNQKKCYKNTFTDESLPFQIRQHLHCIEDIFDYLTSVDNYTVDLETGDILITSSYIVNRKQRFNKTKLSLEPSPMGDYDILALYVNQVTASVAEMKNHRFPEMKKQIENLQEKYENINEKCNKRGGFPLQQLKELENNLRTLFSEFEARVEEVEARCIMMDAVKQNFEERISKLQRMQIVKKESPKVVCEKKNKPEENQIVVSSHSSLSVVPIEKGQFVSKSSGAIADKSQEESQNSKGKQKSSIVAMSHMDEEFEKFQDMFEPTPYLKSFKFDESERKIQFLGDEKEYIQLLLKTVIPRFEYSFKVKITSCCKKSSIFIGVASKAHQKNARSSHKSGNALALYGGGRIWFGPQNEFAYLEVSTRLAEGDEVITTVSRKDGKIEWTVNDKLAGYLEKEVLRDEKYEWVPYFEFKRNGNEIQWLN